MKSRFLLLSMILAIAPLSYAQFDTGRPASKPAWEQFKLPKTTMKLDFRNSSPDMVLALFTKTSGITIIKDPALKDALTLTTAKAVPIAEAFEVLNAALGVRNFEIRKEGNVLVVRQKQNNRGGGSTGFGNMTPEQIQQMMGGGQQQNVELRVFKITYANAAQVARVINDVFQQQQQMMFPGMFGGGGGFGGRGGRGGGGMSFGSSGMTPNVRASSDDYSNTVIVNAPSRMMDQVEDLIKDIDKQTDEPLKPKVYGLKYADATNMQQVVQTVLQASIPRGRGGTSANQPVDRQFSFFPFGGGGGNRNATTAGTVIADTVTNSLIITCTEGNHTNITTLLKELDQEVKMESTTFVFPLANARADQIATLFQQAFGTRNGRTGTGTNRNTGRTNTNTRTNTGRTGGGGGGFGGLGGNVNGSDLMLDMADPDAQSGDLATNVSANSELMAQFGGFGGGNQQNRQNTAAQTGRNANGQIVPVQDLTNQITVIPDQNTNSIIVVTTPENAGIIQGILGQLDKIPEQVMIETMIVEASLDSSNKLGVEWTLSQPKAFGNTGTTGTVGTAFTLPRNAAEGFKYTLTGGMLSAFINILQSDTRFNVLSTPRIFTSNNVEAEINISQRVPFVVSQRTDTNGNITYNYDFEDVGIVLTVTPRITANGYVTMDVSQTANDLQGFTSFNAPIVNQRQASTTVSVKDGETIILGGIIRSTVSSTVRKVPILGDIPILGDLFKSTDKTNAKTELLVFLTPRLVKNPKDAAQMRKEEEGRLSKPTQEQIKKARLSPGKTDPKKDEEKKKSGGK